MRWPLVSGNHDDKETTLRRCGWIIHLLTSSVDPKVCRLVQHTCRAQSLLASLSNRSCQETVSAQQHQSVPRRPAQQLSCARLPPSSSTQMSSCAGSGASSGFSSPPPPPAGASRTTTVGAVPKFRGGLNRCICCDTLGKNISGCSCHGGKSHTCQRETPPTADEWAAMRIEMKGTSKINWCTCCGEANRTAQGCSCRGGKSHTCQNLLGKKPDAPAAEPAVRYPEEIVGHVTQEPRTSPLEMDQPRAVPQPSPFSKAAPQPKAKPKAGKRETEKPTKPAEEHEVWEPRILLRWRRLARQVLTHGPMETEAWHDVAPLEAESDRHNRG